MGFEEERVHVRAEDQSVDGAIDGAMETGVGLEEQLAAEKARAEDYLKNWQRAQADFINYKRRTDQERSENLKYANANLILRLLPVLDDFERAVGTLPKEAAAQTWTQGILMIERKLRAALELEGLKPVDALGQNFDPDKHEAVVQEDAGDENTGKVVAELQKGYILGERLLRPTLVKVGS